VPCDQAVVVPGAPGRWFGADIYGYDDSTLGAELTPGNARWTATCGRGNAFAGDAGLDPYRPTLSQRGFTVAMRGCTSFFGGSDGASQLVVDQAGALGPRRCGLGAGEVSAFRGTLEGVTRTAACGDALVFDVAGAERYHTIDLIGFEASVDGGSPTDASTAPPTGAPPTLADASIDAGDVLDAGLPPAPPAVAPDAGGTGDAGAPVLVLGEPRWRTRCIGRSQPGVASPAFCDPLTPLP
jgi:hypothetical protein